MRALKALLYSLVFSFSSLFATDKDDYCNQLNVTCSAGLSKGSIVQYGGNYFSVQRTIYKRTEVYNGKEYHAYLSCTDTDSCIYVNSTGSFWGGQISDGYFRFGGQVAYLAGGCNVGDVADPSTGVCTTPEPTCEAPQILNTTTNKCEDPIPTCPPSQTYDSNSSSCKCDDSNSVVYEDEHCVADTNHDGLPDMPTMATDSDGDGTVDVQDTDSPFYGLCMGADLTKVNGYYGNVYSPSYYDFYGTTNIGDCEFFQSNNSAYPSVDGSMSRPDVNSACVTLDYCYRHDTATAHSSVNPCQDLFNQVKSTCKVDEVATGLEKCVHNGLNVTNSTISCQKVGTTTTTDKTESDCKNLWHETLNSNTKQCECQSGYERDIWGNCSNSWIGAVPPTDAEKAVIDATNRDNAIAKNASDTSESAAAKTNETLGVNLSTTNEILAGVRTDLKSINDLIDDKESDINTNELLSGTDDLLSAQNFYYESWKNQFTSFKNNIDTQFTTISSRYDDAKNIFNGAHSISLPSGSSSGCSSFVFHGRTIDLIICERLQIFSPIIYFVITLLSMIAVFKFSVNQLLRGLE